MTPEITADFAIQLTLSDGDRTSLISFTPGAGVERVKVLRVVRAILCELGLTKRIWTRATIARMVARLQRECPKSQINWVDHPGGAALRGLRPRKKPGLFQDVVLGQLTRFE